MIIKMVSVVESIALERVWYSDALERVCYRADPGGPGGQDPLPHPF